MANPSFSLLAFDLDGTLVDTESLSLPDVIEQLKADYNLSTSVEHWMTHYHGMSGQSLINRLNADYGTTIDYADFVQQRKARVDILFRAHGLNPAAGVLQMLRRVVGAGNQVAIVSNSNPGRIALTLECMQGQRQHGLLLPALFEGHIFSGTDPAYPTRQSKPAPDVYLAAAAAYKANPADCLALEDSPVGVQAAVAAGFTCWGYTGLSSEPDTAAKLTAAGASNIIAHWDEFNP